MSSSLFSLAAKSALHQVSVAASASSASSSSSTEDQMAPVKVTPFCGYILVFDAASSDSKEKDIAYVQAVANICNLFGKENFRFRVKFASTVLVEERRATEKEGEFEWKPYETVHGRGGLGTADLGKIALPCALLAQANDALPWLAAKPMPRCQQKPSDEQIASSDQTLQSLFEQHVPVFVLRNTFTKDLQLSTRLRANGIFIVIPPPALAHEQKTTFDRASLESVNQSGVDAFAGPCSLRCCYSNAPSASSPEAKKFRILLMKPTSALATRCWLGDDSLQDGTDLVPLFSNNGVSSSSSSNSGSSGVERFRRVGPIIFNQDKPRFFVETERNTFLLVDPNQMVALAPLIVDSKQHQQNMLDLIDQADAGLDSKQHEQLMTRLGAAVEALTRGAPSGRTKSIADMRQQLIEQAGGQELDERRIVTEMASMLRIYAQEQKESRKLREKAIDVVRKRIAASICSTGLTTYHGNLKVALRAKKIQANVERAAEITADELGTLLESACEQQGVLFIQLDPQQFLPALTAREAKHDALAEKLDALISIQGAIAAPGAGRRELTFPFDALTATIIIEQISAQMHPLQQFELPRGPTMLLPSPTGRSNASFFAVPLLDTVIQAHDLGTAFNWMEETNKEHVAIPRILQCDALCKTRVARQQNIEMLPSDDSVRRLVAQLCFRAAHQLAARLSALEGGFRGTDEKHFDDTSRAVLRGLVGWAVMTLTAGTNPQSMVFQLLCSTIGRPERPRNEDDWSTYASLVRLLPSTGWETRTAQTSCARILVRSLNAAIQRFTQATLVATIDDKKRYFAQLCYVDWVCNGLPKTAKRCKMFRFEHGKYRKSMPVSSVVAAFIEAHPEYTNALKNVEDVETFKDCVKKFTAQQAALKAEAKKLLVSGASSTSSAASSNVNVDSIATSQNAAVCAALLTSAVTERQLQDMCESSRNLVRLEEASDELALESIVQMSRISSLADLQTLAQFAGFGKTSAEVRKTYRWMTEFLFAKRSNQNPAEVEESALLAVLEQEREKK